MSIDPKSFGKVAVLMGGDSSEREVSLRSGAAVLAALQAVGVNAVGVESSGSSLLKKVADGDFERVFIMLHGRGGEDGTLQGALELLGLPYTGSGVMGSSVGMDKWITKQLWRASGIPTPPARLVDVSGLSEGEQQALAAEVAEEVGLPAIVKPSNEGSSVGMAKVSNEAELAEAIAHAADYDTRVVVERWVTGHEYTAAMLAGEAGIEALPMIRLETPNSFYDYDAKYLSNNTQYHCPCGLPEDKEKALQALCKEAFEIVGAEGWGRVDLMVDDAGDPWLLEVNTVPGMTDHSLVPMAANAAGISMQDLTLRILASSLKRELLS